MEQFAAQYAPILKMLLVPTMVVISCFIFQRWIGHIVEMLKKLNEFLIAFNRASFLLLLLYFSIVAYVKFT